MIGRILVIEIRTGGCSDNVSFEELKFLIIDMTGKEDWSFHEDAT